QRQPNPVLRQGAMYEDYRRFRREIVRRHIELTLQVLHDEDPGRLVFSQRFMMKHFSDWADLLDLFQAYDGIGVNMYPDNVVPGLGANERAALELIHQRTGKPLLVTEWSIPALDSRLYDNPAKLDWSWDCTVATQTERARQAARVALDQYNLPFVVGAHWFTWKDFNSEKRQANRGLVQANGQPWPELLQALGEVHTRLGSRKHEGSQF
ncbi:MAG TPA: hypothetical protein VNT26_08865, partial [Candidatus Sulfotelmatobacter sp.]|nr:hypothetical protein [Candidatus Sulfotelmatobacter sp.]